MLDATRLANAATVYRANDPAQLIYRALLAGYTETQLNRLEEELGSYTHTGLLPESVQQLLDAAETRAA